MGFLNSLAARFASIEDRPQEGSQNLVQGLLTLLNDTRYGGLSGLVQQFHKTGLGEVVESWIGTGPNRAITPEQVGRGLGAERLQRLSEATGLPVEKVRKQLTYALPTLIDKLTPRGTVPPGNIPEHASSLIKGKFF